MAVSNPAQSSAGRSNLPAPAASSRVAVSPQSATPSLGARDASTRMMPSAPGAFPAPNVMAAPILGGTQALHEHLLTIAARGNVDEFAQAMRKAGAVNAARGAACVLELLIEAARIGASGAVARLIENADGSALFPDKDSSLLCGATRAAPGIMQSLLRKGAPQSHRDKALRMAVVAGNAKAVAMLLEAGASARRIDARGNTPLLLAALAGHDEIVKLLLPHSDIQHANAAGDTALIHAAKGNHLTVVERLVVENARIDQRNHAGEDAIVAAERARNRNVAAVLRAHRAWQAERGAVPLVAQGRTGAVAPRALVTSTSAAPIAFQARYAPFRHPAWNEPAAAQHASPFLITFVGAPMVPASGIDPASLEQAVRNGNGIIVDLLLKHGLDPNARLACGGTLLTIAAMHGHAEVLALLLRAGASIDAIGVDGCTSLMLAIVHRRVGIFQLLLDSRPAANVNAAGRDGWTPLMLAVQFQYPEMVSVLLDAGADVNSSLPEDGWTALMCAARRGNVAIASMLLAYGARPDQLRALPLLSDASMEIALASHGKPSEVMSALIYAVEAGSIEVFDLLLNHRMRCESARAGDMRDMESALMVAAAADRADMVTLMLKALPRLSFDQVRHAIVVALLKGNAGVIEVFLVRGFPCDVLLAHGLDALRMAMESGDREMVDMLMRHIRGDPAATMNQALREEAARGNVDEMPALPDGGASVGYIGAHGKSASALTPEFGHEGSARLLRPHEDEHAAQRSARVSTNRHGQQALDDDSRSPENMAAETADAPGSGKIEVASVANAAEVRKAADPAGNETAAAMPELKEQSASRSKVAKAGIARLRAKIRKAEKEAKLSVARAEAKAAKALKEAEAARVAKVLQEEKAARVAKALQEEEAARAPMLATHGAGEQDAMRTERARYFPLHLAASAPGDQVESVRQLILQGASLEECDEDDMSALGYAAWQGNVGVVDLLLDHGARLHATDSAGRTAWAIATAAGRNDVVRLLLKRVAREDLAGQFGAVAIADAANHGNAELIRLLLSAGAPIDSMYAAGATPLMFAVQNGQRLTVKTLLDAGANVNIVGTYGFTALMYAVHFNRPDLVRELVAAGAAVDAECRDGIRPLLFAADKNYLEVAELLLALGADVARLSVRRQFGDAGDSADGTPHISPEDGAVGLAARNGAVDMLALLLEHWKAPRADEALYGKQVAAAAWLAAVRGHLAAFRLLVKRCPEIPLDHIVECVRAAAEAGHADLAQVLFDGTHDWDEVVSSGGRSLFVVSAGAGWEPVVRMFLAHAPVRHDDASFLPMLTNGLVLAVSGGEGAIAELLLKAGADANGCDEDGIPAIFHAIRQGSESLVAQLLEYGADPDRRTGEASGGKATALIEAVKRQQRGIVALLLERGADRHLSDGREKTPQRPAALSENGDIIRMSMDAGDSDDSLRKSIGAAPAAPSAQ